MLVKQLGIKNKWRDKKIEEVKPIEVNKFEEWKVDKILNKRKIREVIKYLV